MLKWAPSPTGQHIELGISEMNLFMLLGQLGLSHEHHGQHLLPVGTVYDPFVLRGLDALIYGLYNGARFVVAGTPAGVTLAPEGGAHQSTITASVGAELPGVGYAEPCFATEVDWLLCDALAAAAELAAEGVASTVLYLTSPDRMYRTWQGRYRRAITSATAVRGPGHLHRLVPPARRDWPVVSVHDAASHSLAWVGSALGVRLSPSASTDSASRALSLISTR